MEQLLMNKRPPWKGYSSADFPILPKVVKGTDPGCAAAGLSNAGSIAPWP